MVMMYNGFTRVRDHGLGPHPNLTSWREFAHLVRNPRIPFAAFHTVLPDDRKMRVKFFQIAFIVL